MVSRGRCHDSPEGKQRLDPWRLTLQTSVKVYKISFHLFTVYQLHSYPEFIGRDLILERAPNLGLRFTIEIFHMKVNCVLASVNKEKARSIRPLSLYLESFS